MNAYTKIMHLKVKKPNLSTDLSPSYVPVCSCLISYTFREIDTSNNVHFFQITAHLLVNMCIITSLTCFG